MLLMEEVMEEIRKTVDRKVTLKLNDEQRKQLAETLGDDVAKRVTDISVGRIAGFVDAVIVIN